MTADDDRPPPGHAGSLGYVEPGTRFGTAAAEREQASAIRGGYRTRTPGPARPSYDHVGTARERSVDQVKRRQRFVQRHPEVTVTSPRQNGGTEWEASWPAPAPPDGQEPVMQKASHDELRFLLDYLEERFPS